MSTDKIKAWVAYLRKELTGLVGFAGVLVASNMLSGKPALAVTSFIAACSLLGIGSVSNGPHPDKVTTPALPAAAPTNVQASVVTPVPAVTPATPKASVVPAPAAATTPDAKARAVYIVKGGDTLLKIAKDNGLTLRELEALNPQIANLIRVGDRVFLS